MARDQHGTAYIVDNRDGSRCAVYARGESVKDAHALAFRSAVEEARRSNADEGYERFVALTRRAMLTLRGEV
jgi:hypothetical protein